MNKLIALLLIFALAFSLCLRQQRKNRIYHRACHCRCCTTRYAGR